MLDNYAQFNPVPLSIGQFLEFGQRGLEPESYHFLKKELPVRFANIMKEINLLPAALLQMPSVQELQVGLIGTLEMTIDSEKIREFYSQYFSYIEDLQSRVWKS